jgi:hypothetical protein
MMCRVDDEPRSPLPYLRDAPQSAPELNVGAIVSLASSAAGIVFTLSHCIGIWRATIPLVADFAGWITGVLALTSVASSGIGAIQAPKDSLYYRLSMTGYIVGMALLCASAVMFVSF